jgi:uncharacterized protein
MPRPGAGGAVSVPPVSSPVRERLKAALPTALKRRDAGLVAALRATLAAVDNAEAVPAQGSGSLALEETPVGVGVREVARRELSEEEIERLVRAEIAERRAAALVYEDGGHGERAQQLRDEADQLAAIAGLPSA